MRCPDCSKFVSFEGDEEPEVSGEPTVDENGAFDFSVRLFKNCAECSCELKEATFEFDGQIEPDWFEEQISKVKEDGDAVTVEDLEIEVTCSQTEEGGGRYKKAYYGVECEVVVTAPDGDTWEHTFSDKIAASHMDELV